MKTREEILSKFLKMNWPHEYAENGVVSKSDALKAMEEYASQKSEPIPPAKEEKHELKTWPILKAEIVPTAKSLQEEAEAFFNANYSGTERSEFLKPYIINTYMAAAQFKTPPVQEDQELSILSDLGAWMNQEMDITEGQEKLFKESRNRDMAARCDSSIRTYQKVIRRIEQLKSKYTIIPKH
jgi:hypothetical protein